jgi:hypothetical protein
MLSYCLAGFTEAFCTLVASSLLSVISFTSPCHKHSASRLCACLKHHFASLMICLHAPPFWHVGDLQFSAAVAVCLASKHVASCCSVFNCLPLHNDWLLLRISALALGCCFAHSLKGHTCCWLSQLWTLFPGLALEAFTRVGSACQGARSQRIEQASVYRRNKTCISPCLKGTDWPLS